MSVHNHTTNIHKHK